MKNKYPPEAVGSEWMIKRGASGRKDPGFKLVEDFCAHQASVRSAGPPTFFTNGYK